MLTFLIFLIFKIFFICINFYAKGFFSTVRAGQTAHSRGMICPKCLFKLWLKGVMAFGTDVSNVIEIVFRHYTIDSYNNSTEFCFVLLFCEFKEVREFKETSRIL